MLSAIWSLLLPLWTASEVAIAIATRTKRGGGKVLDRGSQAILWIVIIASVTGCEYLRHVLPPTFPDAGHRLRLAAVILFMVALVIRGTAIVMLGKSFSANVAIRESQTVYKGGLYRFLRHPSYLGMVLIFLAIGLHSRNWICFAIAVIPTTAAVLYRIHVEEAALRGAFGEDYLEYCRTTKRLVPGIY